MNLNSFTKNKLKMKKIFYHILAAAAILTACNEEVALDGTGSLSLSVSEVNDQYITRAVDYSTFYVTISGVNGVVTSDGVRYENVPYNTIPSTISELPSGPYSVTVKSHIEEPAAAFETPVYGGSADFTVKTGATTPVTVKCTVQNVKVTIDPTDAFLSELTKYTITVSNGNGSLNWSNDETVTGSNVSVDCSKAGHFSVNALDVKVTGYRAVSGETATWEGKIAEVAAADHHVIKIDAKTTGAMGGITIDVVETVKDKYTDVKVDGFEEVGVEGPDTGENEGGDDEGGSEAEGMSTSWKEDAKPNLLSTDENGIETYELASVMNATLDIIVANRIKTFTVEVSSPCTGFMEAYYGMTGGADLLDLSNPAHLATLKAVGLFGDEKKEDAAYTPIGTDAVTCYLTSLLPLIVGFGPDVDSVHTFVMNLTDETGQAMTLTLPFKYLGN